jgi:hypothetical protein
MKLLTFLKRKSNNIKPLTAYNALSAHGVTVYRKLYRRPSDQGIEPSLPGNAHVCVEGILEGSKHKLQCVSLVVKEC